MSEILAFTDTRKSRWGIRRASDYVNGFAGCLTGGACPASLLGVGDEAWSKCLKEASERFTYANDRMLIKSFADPTDEAPSGAILVFDNILTSTRKDRDGDILDSSGAVLDMKMPLLWQHLSIQPIGKLVAELNRTKSYIKTRFAIADTELGRDAAVLVKFGALRISHGFQPTKYEPIYNEKEQQTGWKMLGFEVFEGSVVSIPSNVDADILATYEKTKAFTQELDGIRTAFGREKLKSPAVTTWAKTIYDARKVVVPGVDLKAADTEKASEKTAEKTAAEPAMKSVDSTDSPVACSCKTKKGGDPISKSVANGVSTKMYGEYHLAGSFEHIQSALSKTLKRHVMSVDKSVGEYTWCFVMATFADHAIVCVEHRNDYEFDSFKLSYVMGSDGPEWSGELVPVDVKVTAEVVESAKAFEVAASSRFMKSVSLLHLKEKSNCKCPECGYEAELSMFTSGKSNDMDADDEKRTAKLEAKFFSVLLEDSARMRKFRDGLTSVLEAREVDAGELSADEVLSDLMAVLA